MRLRTRTGGIVSGEVERPRRSRSRRPVARHRAFRATLDDFTVTVVVDCVWWATVLDEAAAEEVACPRCGVRVPVACYDLPVSAAPTETDPRHSAP